MEYLSRNELRKLSALCRTSYHEIRAFTGSSEASGLDKALAGNYAGFLSALIVKLDRIADSDAKRIEIKF